MQETTPKVNEKGQPFQRLEERVFARYISDIVCGQAELSQITRECFAGACRRGKTNKSGFDQDSISVEK